MPQSSLLGWLSRPAPAKADKAQADEIHQLPTPPPTASEGRERHSQSLLSDKHVDTRPSADREGLPANVELRSCCKEDIKSFKRLNSLLLPIPYGDSFYREILADEVTSNITLMALWHDSPASTDGRKGTLVGAIRCRLLAGLPGSSPRQEGPMLYLSTLVLLSPYRGHGVAAKMLDVIIKRAVNDYGIGSVGAHVWEANDEGLAWYRKRSFREVRREEGYYRRLKPQGAVVMMKDVGVMDLMGVDDSDLPACKGCKKGPECLH